MEGNDAAAVQGNLPLLTGHRTQSNQNAAATAHVLKQSIRKCRRQRLHVGDYDERVLRWVNSRDPIHAHLVQCHRALRGGRERLAEIQRRAAIRCLIDEQPSLAVRPFDHEQKLVVRRQCVGSVDLHAAA